MPLKFIMPSIITPGCAPVNALTFFSCNAGFSAVSVIKLLRELFKITESQNAVFPLDQFSWHSHLIFFSFNFYCWAGGWGVCVCVSRSPHLALH